MMPVHLGDDGASIRIENEKFELSKEAGEWFAAQPDPEEAFKKAIRMGAACMERGGFLEFDGECQRAGFTMFVEGGRLPVAKPQVMITDWEKKLSPAQQKIWGVTRNLEESEI